MSSSKLTMQRPQRSPAITAQELRGEVAPKGKNDKRLNLHVTVAQHRHIKTRAATLGVSVSEFVLAAIAAYDPSAAR